MEVSPLRSYLFLVFSSHLLHLISSGESPPSLLPDAALSPVHIVRVGELAGLREGLEQGEEALQGGQGGDDCLLSVTCSAHCQHHH